MIQAGVARNAKSDFIERYVVMKRSILLIVCCLALVSFGCEQTKDAAKTAEDVTVEAADKAGDAVKEAGEATVDAVKEAADAAADKTEEAANAVKDAVTGDG